MKAKISSVKNISGISDNLLKSIDTNIDVLSTIEKKRKLNNVNIAISISESDELGELGFSNVHPQDAMVEFARYMMVQGAHLIYGGDLRDKGYTFLFSELAYQYRSKLEQDKKHFTNYFSFPIHLQLNNSYLSEFKKNRVEVVKVSAPSGLKINRKKYLPPTSAENKIIWASSLTKMREQMNAKTDARIFIGGKLLKYLGKYPGIIEEALITLNSDKPTYLIGGFGGATKAIIDSVKGIHSKELTDKFQSQNAGFEEFKNLYNKKFPETKIDYTELHNFLKKYGLKKLCKNNGLSPVENERLFITPHIPEMIYYTLKGLNKIFNK